LALDADDRVKSDPTLFRWRTHAAAMVPQIDGIGRPCMECWRGLVVG
jgi:hypothetical protein